MENLSAVGPGMGETGRSLFFPRISSLFVFFGVPWFSNNQAEDICVYIYIYIFAGVLIPVAFVFGLKTARPF